MAIESPFAAGLGAERRHFSGSRAPCQLVRAVLHKKEAWGASQPMTGQFIQTPKEEHLGMGSGAG